MIKEIIKHKEYKKESCFQKDICLYLDYEIANNKLIYYFAIPNGALMGGKNKFSVLHSLKSTGLKNGVSDLVLVFKTTILFLELKLNNTKQSQNQKEFENIINNNTNFKYFLLKPNNINCFFTLINNID